MIDRKGGAVEAAIEEARRQAEQARRAEARDAAQRAAAAGKPAAPAASTALPFSRDGYAKSTEPTPFAPREGTTSGAAEGGVDSRAELNFEGFDPQADVNMDGRINIPDLAQIAGQYGQRGPHLPSDIDGNRRVDILDLSRAAGAYGTAAYNMSILEARFDKLFVGEDPVRGPYFQLGGQNTHPIPAKDAFMVITDAHGQETVKAKVETFVEGRWKLVLLKEDLPETLLRTVSFEATLYTQATSGEWYRAQQTLLWPM